MSWTRRNTIICDECGLFCKPFDTHAPFGGTGPEGLDPPEDEHVCEKCWPAYKERWQQGLRRYDSVGGDWAKSRAEVEAAKELGLEWVHSRGYVDSRTGREILYRYIKTAEKEYYVPYLQWFKEHPRFVNEQAKEGGKDG